MPNLALAILDKRSDKVAVLHRVLNALLDDKDCYYSIGREWKPLTREQTSNWRARRTILKLVDKVRKK